MTMHGILPDIDAAGFWRLSLMDLSLGLFAGAVFAALRGLKNVCRGKGVCRHNLENEGGGAPREKLEEILIPSDPQSRINPSKGGAVVVRITDSLHRIRWGQLLQTGESKARVR